MSIGKYALNLSLYLFEQKSINCTPRPLNQCLYQCLYQVLTFHTLQFLQYIMDKILKVKVTTARAKVKTILTQPL